MIWLPPNILNYPSSITGMWPVGFIARNLASLFLPLMKSIELKLTYLPDILQATFKDREALSKIWPWIVNSFGISTILVLFAFVLQPIFFTFTIGKYL